MNTEFTKSESLKRRAAIALAITAGVVFVITFVNAEFYALNGEAEAPRAFMAATPAYASSTMPSRLQIPSLGIDANVQFVGVTASNDMATPHGFSDVGWYRYGTVPGHIGNAVIDGHVDNGLGLAGVFKRLDDIKQGDDIYVVDASGRKLRFVVDKIADYPYKDVPTNDIFGRNDAARLNLITCEGAWVGRDRTYDHRLVVFATFRPS